jgi:LmbE family N-acetylglucosaminyl deacetylase
MKFSRPEASLYAPARQDPLAGLSTTTHLGIGAHADDLEILAFPGISACYRHPSHRFSGVVVTDGAGAPRSGSFAKTSDSEMVAIRREEQQRAADLGLYASVIQLGYPSQEIKKPDRSKLINDILQILTTAQPQILYLHNPVDRHETHLAVLLACIEALKQIPENSRPREIYGCEVWGDLDWVPASQILRLPCSAPQDFGPSLLRCFASQVDGGKRYDLAAQGRRRAQATFGDAYTPDQSDEVVLALDLKPLLQPEASLSNFVSSLTEEFRAQAICRTQKVEQGG